MKACIIRLLSIVFLSSVLLWHFLTYRNPALTVPEILRQKPVTKLTDVTDSLMARYSTSWKKQENNSQLYRSLLGGSCNAVSKAVITQGNSPVKTIITYDGERKKTLMVTPALYNVFTKESPFKKALWDSCAVVGNGGILANSSCGKQIDSASYVLRCNLPPIGNGYERDTGSKTSLVTANPSILITKYSSLNERHHQAFVEDVRLYGDALLLLPAFSYLQNTGVSLRALYSLEDVGSQGPRVIFFNPAYLISLAQFWHSQGIRAVRLSTGMMMVSLALEVCNNVHLYGFWPYEKHPYTHQPLNNHYYDDQPVNDKVHAMPAEFEALLTLHEKGVVNLHIGKCINETMWTLI